MKRLWFIAILAAAGSACVEGNNPVQLVDVVPFTESCERDEGISIIRGSLDYNASNHYYTTLSLASPLTAQEAAVGVGFYADEIVYNYESRNPKTSFKEESLPIYFAVPADAQPDDTWMSVDLIGDQAREKLEGVVPTYPDTMTLLVTVKVRGKLSSGRDAETNELTFPIEISRVQAPCAEGQVAVPVGGCLPGQDGTPFTCQ